MKKYFLSMFIVFLFLNGALAELTTKNTQTTETILPVLHKVNITTQKNISRKCEYPDQAACYNSGCAKLFGYECQQCVDNSYACIKD